MITSAKKLRAIAPLFLLAAVASATAACSRAPRIAVGAGEATLSPALVGVCAVFLKIENLGDAADALVAARAELPGAITEIHEVRDGRMVKSGKVAVPAKGVLELRPGGLHIMVFNVPKSAAPGDEFGLRLVFESSGEKLASVKIRR